MLDINNENVLQYINNYNINLIEPIDIRDFKTFKTDLGAVLEYINISKNDQKLLHLIEQNDISFTDMNELSVALINATTGSHISIELNKTQNGGVNVCEGLKKIIENEKNALQVIIDKKDNVIAEKDNTIAEKDNAIAEKDNAIAKKDAEIADLKRQLEALRA